MKPRLGNQVEGWGDLTEQERREIMNGVQSGHVNPIIDGYADLDPADRAELAGHLVANEREYQALEATKQANSGPQDTWLDEVQNNPDNGIVTKALAAPVALTSAMARGAGHAAAILPDAGGFVARTVGEATGNETLKNIGTRMGEDAQAVRRLSDFYAPRATERSWTEADNRLHSALSVGGEGTAEFAAPMGAIGTIGKVAKAAGASDAAAAAIGAGTYFGTEGIPQTARMIEEQTGKFDPVTATVAGGAKAALMAVLIPRLMQRMAGGTEAQAQAAAAEMLSTPQGMARARMILGDIAGGAAKGSAEMAAIGAGSNAVDEMALGRTPTVAGMTEAAVEGVPLGLVMGVAGGGAKRAATFSAQEIPRNLADAIVTGRVPEVVAENPVISNGPRTVAYTKDRKPIEMQFEVVEADAVKASRDEGYPAELQPRDTTRQSSEALVNKIGAGPFAPWLGASNRISDGSPIVGPDSVVEVGNHRTDGIRQSYQRGTASQYREWLIEQAPALGLDPVKVAEMREPLLIRRRVTPVEDRVQFAKDANERPMLGMSESEQALSDVQAARDSINLLKRGSIESSGNQEFLQRFIQAVAPSAEQWSTMVDRNGSLSSTGLRRVRSALFALAYGGDQAAIERLAEGTDDQAANATKALQMSAPALGAMEAKIANGTLVSASIAPDVSAALNKLNTVRAQGGSVIESLKPEPPSLEGTGAAPMSQGARDMLAVLEQGKRGHRAVSDVLTSYADAVEKIGNPKQIGLDGVPVSVDREALLRKIIADKGLKNADELIVAPEVGGLFAEPSMPEGVAAMAVDPADTGKRARLAPNDTREVDGNRSVNQSSLNDVVSKANTKGVVLDVSENPRTNILTLSRIVVPQGSRSIGVGSSVMVDLIKYADSRGLRIALTPSTDFGASSVERLKRFYKRFGFTENKGRSRDLSVSETMVREPSGQSSQRLEVIGDPGPNAVQAMAGGVFDRRDQQAVPENATITEPVKRSDLLQMLRVRLGLPIRSGAMQMARNVLGIFKIKSEVIRARDVKDIEVVSHEVGHAVAKSLGLDDAALAPFARELHPMASRGNPTQEGFAEFLRYYITDEAKAAQRAPTFLREFENRLAVVPDIGGVLKDARGRWEKYLSQPALQRVLSNISTDPNEGVRPRTWTQTFQDVYTMAVDQLAPIQRAVADMTGGKAVGAGQDAYKLARLFKGWTGKAAAFIEFKPFNYKTLDFDPKAKGLREILTPIKDQLPEFGAYLAARRTLELHGRNIETGIRIDDAGKVMAKYHGQFGQAAADLYAFQDSVLRYMVDAGVLSNESYAKMKAANRDYIPFYRIMGDGESIGQQAGGSGGGMELRSKPVKNIKGSTRDIIDPVESVIKNTYAFIHAAERNAVGQALVELAEKTDGMGKYVEKIPMPKERVQFMLEDIKRQLPQDVRDAIDQSGMGDEVMSIFRPSAHLPERNVLAVWRKGKMELFQISPEIEGAMKNLDAEQMNMLVKMLSVPAKVLRAGATLTPEFVLRNPMIDQLSAFTFSRYGFKPGFDVLRGLFHVLAASDNAVARGIGKAGGGSADLYWKWMASGGANSELVAMNRESMQNQMNKAAGIGREVRSVGDLVDWVLSPMQRLSLASEQATRLGEFARGINAESKDKAGVLNAAFASREVTLDFARMGAKTKALNSIAAFFNAGVQGFDKAVRELSTRTDVWLRLAPLALASVALVASQANDPRYRDIPAWQRDMYWCLIDPRAPRITQEQYDAMTPEQKLAEMNRWIVRIPKPREVGMLFISLPERIANRLLGQDPHALDGFMMQFGKSLVPNLGVTAVNPIIENAANYSFFTDRPVEGAAVQGLQPAFRYDTNSLELTKELAQRGAGVLPGIVNSAPKIENVIRNYGGGLGMMAAQAADKIGRATGLLDDQVKPAATWSDVPLARGFVVRMPTTSAEPIERWRRNYEHASQQLATWKDLVERGQMTKAQEVQAQQTMIDLHKVQAGVTEWSKYARKIRDANMTPEQKRAELDKAALMMAEVARMGNDLADKLWNEGQPAAAAPSNR